MFLRKEQIQELQAAQQVFVEDTFEQSCLDQWSYSLRLGNEVYLSPNKTSRRLTAGEMISIEPGEFALLMTHEKLRMPLNHVAFISLKFSHALKGLINISGFHIDPAFEGYIMFSVYNAGPKPVVLRQGDQLFMIIFSKLDGEAELRPPSAQFKTLPRLEAKFVEAVRGPTVSLLGLNEKVNALESGLNEKMGRLESEVTSLRGDLKTAIWAIVVAVVVAVVVALITKVLGLT